MDCSADLVTADEPERGDHKSADEQHSQGSEQDDGDSESGQHPGQQEPDSGEGESATTQLLAIDRPLGLSRPRHSIPLTS
jgi:hypothetical protein